MRVASSLVHNELVARQTREHFFNYMINKGNLAERRGFEPRLPFRVNTLSKRAPSATRTSLRASGRTKIIAEKWLKSKRLARGSVSGREAHEVLRAHRLGGDSLGKGGADTERGSGECGAGGAISSAGPRSAARGPRRRGGRSGSPKGCGARRGCRRASWAGRSGGWA
jgi:hypothetical protein